GEALIPDDLDRVVENHLQAPVPRADLDHLEPGALGDRLITATGAQARCELGSEFGEWLAGQGHGVVAPIGDTAVISATPGFELPTIAPAILLLVDLFDLLLITLFIDLVIGLSAPTSFGGV